MLHVVYDGQCGFCRRSLRVARALDVRDRFRFHDGTDRARIARLFPELAGADLNEAMFAVDAARQVTRGFFAFRRMIWESPLAWPLLPLFYFPGAGGVGPRVYAWVARNRRSFGCESEVCELPAGHGSRRDLPAKAGSYTSPADDSPDLPAKAGSYTGPAGSYTGPAESYRPGATRARPPTPDPRRRAPDSRPDSPSD